MKHLFCVENSEELQKFQRFSEAAQEKLTAYLEHLRSQYDVTDLPGAIVWTSAHIAAQCISHIPIPAYTNELRTIFCPELDSWREIYLHQLDGIDAPEIEKYYETQLTENHILQILGHEFVHHSDLFIDEAWEASRWFEEGMCEYISRRYFLTEQEFDAQAEINTRLVSLYESREGSHPLETFGQKTYEKNYADIFYEYWRSFLTVYALVSQYDGNISAVFYQYHQWYQANCPVSLLQWLMEK